ncbi:MAG: hypothetical protein ACE5PV_08655 [Candidatus Poribacteria bacterium]
MQKIIRLSMILIFMLIILSLATNSVYAQAKLNQNIEKLESVLVHIANQAEQLGIDNAVAYAARRNIPIINGKVRVIVIINPEQIPNPQQLAAAARGIEIEGVRKKNDRIESKNRGVGKSKI